MDDKKWTTKKSENHFDFGDIGVTIALMLMALALVGYLLYRGIEAGNTIAIVVTTGVVVLSLIAIGVGLTLFILNTASRREERRSLTEQSRWQDNAIENLQIMGSMQKVQNQQNAMLLKQAREAQRALPAPEGDVIEGFVFDPAMFDELDVDELEEGR